MTELIGCPFKGETMDISEIAERFDEQHCFDCIHLETCRSLKEKDLKGDK